VCLHLGPFFVCRPLLAYSRAPGKPMIRKELTDSLEQKYTVTVYR
jgi:hypothetical protein